MSETTNTIIAGKTSPITKDTTWAESFWNMFLGESTSSRRDVSSDSEGENNEEKDCIFLVCSNDEPIGWFSTEEDAKKAQTQELIDTLEFIDSDFDLCKVTIDSSDPNNIEVYTKRITTFTLLPSLYSTISIVKVSKGVVTNTPPAPSSDDTSASSNESDASKDSSEKKED